MWRVVLVLVLGCGHPAPPPSSSAPPPRDPPPKGRIVVSDTNIELLQPVRFDGQSAAVTLDSRRALDAIAETINGNPEIELVEVTAYGNDGAAQFQQLIGQQRAQTIVDYLVHHGVAAHRVRAKGIAQSPSGNVGPEFVIVWHK